MPLTGISHTTNKKYLLKTLIERNLKLWVLTLKRFTKEPYRMSYSIHATFHASRNLKSEV
jgi:hypothetical protein